jgi:hypothetical protein
VDEFHHGGQFVVPGALVVIGVRNQ